MKNLTLFFAVMLILLSSCTSFTEKLFLESDGSGKFYYSLDMSDMLGNEMLEGFIPMLTDEIDKGNSDGKPSITDSIQQYLSGEESFSFDTMISFADVPDSIVQKIDDPELLKFAKNMTLGFHADSDEKVAIMTLGMEFDKIEDIAKSFEAINKLSKKEGKKDEVTDKLGSFKEMWGGFTISKKKLIREKVDPNNEGLKELTENDDALGMMELFFGNTKFITEYHFPGKVKKVTIPNAKIKGNTVIVENDVLDVLKRNVGMDGYIKFKKK